MTRPVRPGDWLSFDPMCSWVVLAVDGTRVLLADLDDEMRGGWFDIPNDPMPHTDEHVQRRIACLRESARQVDHQAAELEDEARCKRRNAERLRANADLAERLRAAGEKR
jgi:hypothetical protein